ncbi:hypothetical protein BC936DRAFT_145617 [Jimgerdemannia flammicorona]|uniref:Uncharacterized protein n=2 Tax=Jimgerdemannia flammicorona TaxID=994334 RepID=A0A433QZL6_9FUNG|nr:hypothetical protein BC936DRAFT_145617 [Jimgerdemannia flammicorona]RUS35223.1 hypothetical protein BC938DRAFT_474074 [Jimgerdemannia flammicorona]
MSEFRFVLPPNASQPQSQTTFLQVRAHYWSVVIASHALNVSNCDDYSLTGLINQKEDIQDEGGKVELDGDDRLSASSFWQLSRHSSQPTTPTPTSNKLLLQPFISHPCTKATPETPTAPTTSLSVAPSYSSLDTPSFLSPAQFILPSTQPQSPDIVVASLSQWACSIKLPSPSPTSWTTATCVKEGASNEDRNAYKAGGGKGALYVK